MERFEYARPDGRILSADRARLDCLEPIVHEGQVYECITASPRWGIYEGPDAKRRAFYRRDCQHPRELVIDGATFKLRREDPPGRAPAGHVAKHGTTYGGKLPVSRAFFRRGGGTITTLHGHTVQEFPDGGYADLQGRPIVATKADEEREMARCEMRRVEQDDADE